MSVSLSPLVDLLLLFSDTSPTPSNSGNCAPSATPRLALAASTLASEIFASEKTVERVLSSIYSKYGLVGTSKIENPRVRATLIFRGLSK